jgi:hypothetical protein
MYFAVKKHVNIKILIKSHCPWLMSKWDAYIATNNTQVCIHKSDAGALQRAYCAQFQGLRQIEGDGRILIQKTARMA